MRKKSGNYVRPTMIKKITMVGKNESVSCPRNSEVFFISFVELLFVEQGDKCMVPRIHIFSKGEADRDHSRRCSPLKTT